MTTLLQELRAVREQVLEHAIKDVPVPPDGRFVIRCKPPADRDKFTHVIAVYRQGGALSAAQEAQVFVDVCDEILLRDPDTGDLERVPGGDGPLRFDAGDERWDGECKTARECVAKLFNLDLQPMAAAGIADVLIDWLQGLEAEAAARAEGKSASGARPSSTPPESSSTE